MFKCPDGIKPDDWAEVRTAVGLFVRQLRGTDLHYHNIIGNNKDALMHVFGMAPMTFGAMMLTAGVLKLRKARGGGDDDKILSINKGHWESIMADAKIDDTGKMTTYGTDKAIVVSIGDASLYRYRPQVLPDDGRSLEFLSGPPHRFLPLLVCWGKSKRQAKHLHNESHSSSIL